MNNTDKKSVFTTCKIIIIFTLLLVFVAIVILISIYYDNTPYPNDYAIVFDAGSSGTRMSIYYWQSGLSAAKGDKLIVNQLDYCKTNDKGIDKFTSKSDVILSFNDCMQSASRIIPARRKFRTYIGLAATAGMRLLNVTNSTLASQILSYISDYFAASEYYYVKNSSQVQIIDGFAEGINAWISVNYFLNKFSVNSNPLKTMGTLDLGGASTQIVFIPDNMNNVDYKNNLKIYGVNYNPFSHSYLCWGANQISLIYQTYLLISNNYSTNAPGSCYPFNYNFTIDSSQIWDSPCASGKLFNFSIAFNISNLNAGSKYTIVGTSNATQCAIEMLLLFPRGKCPTHDLDTCAFNGVSLPARQNTQFYAFSSLFYQFNNTEALMSQVLTNNLKSFRNATDNICNKTYEELTNLNNETQANIQSTYLYNTCFTNNYVISLLSQYGILNLDNVQFVDKINGNTVGWTLGFMIDQLNRNDFLPYEARPRRLENLFFIPAITVFSCITCFFMFVLVFYLFRIYRRKERTYF